MADLDLKALLDAHGPEAMNLLEEYINPALAKVCKIIGFDIIFTRGQGQYLYDAAGNQYLDCLGGFGTFACGRNHPGIRNVLKQAMDLDLPNLPKFGAAALSGILAKELVKIAPGGGELNMVYFGNSGAEGCEGAMKFARAATGRNRIIYCKKGYHGLTMGALSCNGGEEFREGFGTLLTDTTAVPFNDLAALERELSKKDAAGFMVEPIQGKGVTIPSDDYLPGAQALCAKYGTLFIVDEVQTGMGRTGKMFASEYWNLTPDILVVSKALSGGYVPIAAVLCKKWIHKKVFSSMERCVVHSSTFSQNDLAMAAGLATLHVMREEKIVENAAAMGKLLQDGLAALKQKHDMVKDVRGRGMMIAIEFGPPGSLMLKAQWHLIHKLDASLFPQAILIPLMKDHHILAQVAGHHLDVIKLIPSLIINKADVDHIVKSFDTVITSCSRMSGPLWEVGKRLTAQAMKRDESPVGAKG